MREHGNKEKGFVEAIWNKNPEITYKRSPGSRYFTSMKSGPDPDDDVARRPVLCLLLNNQFVICSCFVNKTNPSTEDRGSSEFSVSQRIHILWSKIFVVAPGNPASPPPCWIKRDAHLTWNMSSSEDACTWVGCPGRYLSADLLTPLCTSSH